MRQFLFVLRAVFVIQIVLIYVQTDFAFIHNININNIWLIRINIDVAAPRILHGRYLGTFRLIYICYSRYLSKYKSLRVFRELYPNRSIFITMRYRRDDKMIVHFSRTFCNPFNEYLHYKCYQLNLGSSVNFLCVLSDFKEVESFSFIICEFSASRDLNFCVFSLWV